MNNKIFTTKYKCIFLICFIITNIIIQLCINALIPDEYISGLISYRSNQYEQIMVKNFCIITSIILVIFLPIKVTISKNYILIISVTCLTFLFIYLSIVKSYRSYELGYAYAALLGVLLSQCKSKKLHLLFFLAGCFIISWRSFNIISIFTLLITEFLCFNHFHWHHYKKTLIILSLIICAFSPTPKVTYNFMNNSPNYSYFSSNYDNSVTRKIIHDISTESLQDSYDSYIFNKYSIHVNDSYNSNIAYEDTSKKLLSNKHIEYILPDLFYFEYTALYLFIKNKLLLIILSISHLITFLYLYKLHSVSNFHKYKLMYFSAYTPLMIKELYYFIANLGYSQGKTMGLFLMSDNNVILFTDLLLFCIIIVIIKNIFCENQT